MSKIIVSAVVIVLLSLPIVFAITTPPIITVHSPQHGEVFKNSFLLNVSINELGLVFASYNYGETNISLNSTNNLTFTHTESSLSDGDYVLTIYALDLLTNLNQTTINITVDSSSPNLSIKSNSFFNTSNFTVEVNSSEELINLWYTINNAGNFTLTTSDNIFFYENLDFNDGHHNLTFYATDLAGNINTLSWEVLIDTEKPILNLLSPQHNIILGNSIVSFHINVTELNLLNLTLFVDNVQVAANKSGNQGEYYFSQDLIDGTYEWYVVARDLVNNIATSTIMNFSINLDTTPPDIDSISLTPGSYNSLFSFEVVASDSDGVGQVQYRFENSTTNTTYFNAINSDEDTWSASINVSNVDDGSYNVRINVSDTLGNYVEELILGVSIDITTPNITNFVFTPPLPIYTQQILANTKNATVDFNSSEYPFNFNFFLQVFGSTVAIGPTEVVSAQSDLDTNRFFPQLTTELTYSVYFNMTDFAGNGVYVYAGDIIIDATNPAVSNVALNESQTITTNTLNLNYTNIESNIITRIELFYLNGTLLYINETNTSIGNISQQIFIPQNISDNNYTLNITFRDLAKNNLSFLFENKLFQRLKPNVTILLPTTTINVSKLVTNLTLYFSEEINEAYYALNGEDDINITEHLVNNKINIDLPLHGYGEQELLLRYTDTYNQSSITIYNFTANLVISETANQNDSDGDSILDIVDNLIGSGNNIYSNHYTNMWLTVDGSSNLSQEFNTSLDVVLYSNSTTLIEFEYDFSIKPLNLTNVVIEFYNLTGGYSGFNIRGLDLEDGQTKTAYFEIIDKSINFNLCIIDRANLSITNFISNPCNEDNMTLINLALLIWPLPLSVGDYTLRYTDITATTIQIDGLEHSGIQTLCQEDWSCTSYSSCSGTTQTRTCIDTNSCGTENFKPQEQQSCSEDESSESSSGGGSGGSGGFSDTTDDSSDEEEPPLTENTIVEEDKSGELLEEQVSKDNSISEDLDLEDLSEKITTITRELPQQVCEKVGKLCSHVFIPIVAVALVLSLISYKVVLRKDSY